MIAKVRRRDTSREIPAERPSLVVSIILKSSTGDSQNGSGRFRQIRMISARRSNRRPVQLKPFDFIITTPVGESGRAELTTDYTDYADYTDSEQNNVVFLL